VTAYQAERSSAPGLRVLVHPQVMRRNAEAYLRIYTVALSDAEINDASTHELRFWRADEAAVASTRLQEFRDGQDLPVRAKRHYDAAIAAYGRFGSIQRELPHVTPALWL